MRKLLIFTLLIFHIVILRSNFVEFSIYRRCKSPVSTWAQLTNRAQMYYFKFRDFLREVFYKMTLPHRSSTSLADAIYNIELGTPSGVRAHATEVVLRSVDEGEYAIAREGISIFSSIYGKVKDARIETLIGKFEDDFQTIRTAPLSEQEGLERECAERIWQELTTRERELFTQRAQEITPDVFSDMLGRMKERDKQAFLAKLSEINSRPELLLFTTLFAVSNERNYIRDREMDKLRLERQTYEVFMDAIREEIEGFDPTERVIELLKAYGYLEVKGIASEDKEAIDEFMEEYFLSGAQNPASREEIQGILVEGPDAPTGSYSIREMLDAIVRENVRIREELEAMGIEVDGFVEDVYREINIKILARQDLTEEDKRKLIEDFNRAISNIDRWREKLAETGSDDIKDELVEIAKAKAQREGIPNAKLQQYIDDFLYQEVRLGKFEGQLLFVVQAFVRWVMDYRFGTDGEGLTLRDRLDNLMDPEVARRATRLALFMIFDTGPRDYLGNPLR